MNHRCWTLRARLFLAVGGGAALLLTTAHAHHSPAAFDQTREVVVEGKVIDVSWKDPHI